MAAIFPTGSSREPIAFLQRALRRQLSLKNCLCHVRHIFLAFPLFSSLAPGVPGLLRLSLPRGQSLASRFFPVFPSRSYLASSCTISAPRRRFASLIFFVHPRPWPPLHPSYTYSSSSFSAASASATAAAAAAALLFLFFQLSFLFYHSFLFFLFFFSSLLYARRYVYP